METLQRKPGYFMEGRIKDYKKNTNIISHLLTFPNDLWSNLTSIFGYKHHFVFVSKHRYRYLIILFVTQITKLIEYGYIK